ncbi:helix-turn-helix domain-containing protein [Nocardioides sp. W7]|uniref:PucR family transcriptional regulator n=1 Tax=Nocardioides sp. W7 TaxID=2931390 RepID=UPI001FD5AAEB|nr:helix-turn-helix domain-containing protein [Nocardioides sp. W7]
MTDGPALAPEPIRSVHSQPFRALLLQMVEPIVDQIRAEVPAYAGAAGGRRHQLMIMAANAAIRAHLDTSGQHDSTQRKVDELFRRMGWGEAQDGNPTDNLEAAFAVGGRATWERLADYAVAQGFTAKALRDVSHELADLNDHLRAELLAGHELRTGRPQEVERARHELLGLFRNTTAGRVSPLAPLGVDLGRLSELAERAQWPIPERAVALAVSFHGECPAVSQRPEVLWMRDESRLHIVCAARFAQELADGFVRSGSDRRVAISAPVPPVEAGTALLWAVRALDLVQAGAIPATPVVRCEDHLTQLWLHAEPAMRKRLCQELLEPLLAEPPNSREILSETLLVWLESRESAPAIASRLDVHPQTIRYRWRRINELFGDALRSPDFMVQLTLVLKASVPMWKGGDQSDFELFRDTRDVAE